MSDTQQTTPVPPAIPVNAICNRGSCEVQIFLQKQVACCPHGLSKIMMVKTSPSYTGSTKSWIHYNALQELLPSTPKGKHVHHPGGQKHKSKSNVAAPPHPNIAPHPELEIPADAFLSQSLDDKALVATQSATQEVEEVTDLMASQKPATPPWTDLLGTPGASGKCKAVTPASSAVPEKECM
ncbi:hypothetical protein C8Q76DRAFT_689267 [Earliella scabrosa]|nr:hypothetical protein C8Q76DRAFT_689267 [Earliella scabrosa]